MTHVYEGKVMRAHAGFFDVLLDDEVVRCRMRGRLKKERIRTDICVVGDDVRVQAQSDGGWVLEEVLPRRSRFSRLHPGAGARREDVLIANLDQLLVTLCYGLPRFNARLLDRFLIIAEHQSLTATVLMNKSDLATSADREEIEPYRDLGYHVIETSTKTGDGLDELQVLLQERISAFAGPSGVGKSSLSNAVLPGLSERVGEVSDRVGKGRHITRVASLFPVPSGGFVADTPGIRELASWQLPVEALGDCFVEFRDFTDGCSFRQCSHSHEPGCAVKDAAERGEISEARYASYLRMLEASPEPPLSSRDSRR